MTKDEKIAIHSLLHRLWTKATGTPDYIKTDWINLEYYILKMQKELEEKK